jgi:ribosomal-protein-serine acetyltransferase
MFRYRIDEETELRLLEERHAQELFALIDQNRTYLREWLPWVDGTTSLEDTRKFIRFSLEQFARNEGFNAGIWYHSKLAGVIGHHKINWANRKTSIGYWLGVSFQGKGLMTKSCRAVVNYDLNELKLNRIEIRCAVENRKSRAIPERLGFRQEGIIRQAEWLYDHFVDLVVYGMLADEWKS